jgi:hypothetical protein
MGKTSPDKAQAARGACGWCVLRHRVGFSNSSFQSILLPVREADAIVDGFRVEGDWPRQHGIPAHLTLAGPWPLSHELPRERLAQLAAEAWGLDIDWTAWTRWVTPSACSLKMTGLC